jgi:hypothetical protein
MYLYRAVMLLDYLLRNVQPQAHIILFRCVKELQEMLPYLWRYAIAGDLPIRSTWFSA